MVHMGINSADAGAKQTLNVYNTMLPALGGEVRIKQTGSEKRRITKHWEHI